MNSWMHIVCLLTKYKFSIMRIIYYLKLWVFKNILDACKYHYLEHGLHPQKVLIIDSDKHKDRIMYHQ